MTNLLLVEDNQLLKIVEERHLRDAFPELIIHVASTGEEARRKADAHAPDLAVMDCRLPDCDCQTLLKDLVGMSPELSVIITSAEPPKNLQGKEFAANIYEVITKPYETEDLVGVVSRALRSKGFELSPKQADGVAPIGNIPAAPEFDRHRALNLLSGLLAGLRAFEADLEAEAESAEDVKRAVADYIPRLIGMVRDVTAIIRATTDQGAKT